MECSFQTEKHGQLSVVRIIGSLGLNDAETLWEVIKPLLSGDCPCVIMDLGALSYIGSRALGVLIRARSEAIERKGRIILAEVPPALEGTVRVARLDSIFEIVSDLKALLERYDGALGKAAQAESKDLTAG